MMMRHALFLLALVASPTPLWAQAPTATFDWEVRNRFRLFSHEEDFDKHVEAWRASAAHANPILASEKRLAAHADSGGHGWARHMRLCFDPRKGRLIEDCERVDSDGNKLKERLVNHPSHRLRFNATITGAVGATCIWSFGKGFAEKTIERPCADEVNNRLTKGAPASVSLAVRPTVGAAINAPPQMVEARDVLIVGMGDSIASGEGNPNDPVRLREDGFCYRRVGFGNKQFMRPSRVRDTTIPSACPQNDNESDFGELFARSGAKWLYAQCHRSLYSHQTRTALGLAIEQTKISVTYIPLGCSGAEIVKGMIEGMPARERPFVGGKQAIATVTAQFAELASYIGARGEKRRPDLVLLTIGANDIGFGGLVSDVILLPGGERDAVNGGKDNIVTPARARELLKQKLRPDFVKLRARLSNFIGDLAGKVVFTAYANPAKDEDGDICKSSRRGFDVHPAFAVDGAKMRATFNFVENEFIPQLRGLAQCTAGGCRPDKQAMIFVEAHRDAFERHGFCATSAHDPQFDRFCFRDGDSFNDSNFTDPLACRLPASDFRAYAPRERWVRTANDSYFSAMTHSATLPKPPLDIHDAAWGLSAAVHGGAIHPTAEGHAAMADAAIDAARTALKLSKPAPP